MSGKDEGLQQHLTAAIEKTFTDFLFIVTLF
jgi:hypothetical protein